MADIEIWFFFYLIEKHIFFILALEKDSEKATKLLESLKHEGIDLHEQSTKFTKIALTTLFGEKGLELPEKVIMSIDRTLRNTFVKQHVIQITNIVEFCQTVVSLKTISSNIDNIDKVEGNQYPSSF